jgi:hypothetical protein
MAPIGLILWVFAFVLFFLAALPWVSVDPRRFHLVAAGLACIAFAEVIGRAGPLFAR